MVMNTLEKPKRNWNAKITFIRIKNLEQEVISNALHDALLEKKIVSEGGYRGLI
jgi:phage pi2 protein 07